MALAQILKNLVSQSVAEFGHVVEHQLGRQKFLMIENIRKKMAALRSVTSDESDQELLNTYHQFRNMSRHSRYEVAHAFTLMLELMNSCENAYRSFQTYPQLALPVTDYSQSITFVFTAHPTEARSPQNISVFHEIQCFLIQVLQRTDTNENFKMNEVSKNKLFHLLTVAWQTSIFRTEKPKVSDEAESLYSLILRDDVLFSLLELESIHRALFIRTWVGGDKDGHPGVNETVLLESLTISRAKLIIVITDELQCIKQKINLCNFIQLEKEINFLMRKLKSLKKIGSSDYQKVKIFVSLFHRFRKKYTHLIGAANPKFQCIELLLRLFPGLVVPLELRESSDVISCEIKKQSSLTITKMFRCIARISNGGDPRFYASCFIISMTQTTEQLLTAARLQEKIFAGVPLPIVPLFEEVQSLQRSAGIMSDFLKNKKIKSRAKKSWNSHIEMMVGYSDSSKESGALASRIAIADALPKLEEICIKSNFIPVFFHGSGGSVDRGGGSIEDQIAWWPHSAQQNYKVTIQGEMIDRTLASPAIAKSGMQKIITSTAAGLAKPSVILKSKALKEFASRVAVIYEKKIKSPYFLKVVESATPYSYLRILKIGSRPTKRHSKLEIQSLRAIPWVLCWTQTRVLFQTWWGLGTAWEDSDHEFKIALKSAYATEPVFKSFIKALGFTLAKVDLSIWQIYLSQSDLDKVHAATTIQEFKIELKKTLSFFHDLTAETELLWFRPWLQESIQLRSPMIHPLNVLQVLAAKDDDPLLLRLTVTGISSGMMTTG